MLSQSYVQGQRDAINTVIKIANLDPAKAEGFFARMLSGLKGGAGKAWDGAKGMGTGVKDAVMNPRQTAGKVRDFYSRDAIGQGIAGKMQGPGFHGEMPPELGGASAMADRVEALARKEQLKRLLATGGGLAAAGGAGYGGYELMNDE